MIKIQGIILKYRFLRSNTPQVLLEGFTRWSTLFSSAGRTHQDDALRNVGMTKSGWSGNGQGCRTGKGKGQAQELSRRRINRDVVSRNGFET